MGIGFEDVGDLEREAFGESGEVRGHELEVLLALETDPQLETLPVPHTQPMNPKQIMMPHTCMTRMEGDS